MDVADRVDASLPVFISEEISKRRVVEIAEKDKYASLLDVPCYGRTGAHIVNCA